MFKSNVFCKTFVSVDVNAIKIYNMWYIWLRNGVIYMVNDINIQTKFKILGYEDGNELLHIDDNLIEIANLLNNTSHKVKEKFWLCSKKRIVDTTKELLNDSFVLHDVKYITDDVTASMAFLLQNKLIDYDTLLNRFYVSSIMMSPFDLPIKYGNDARLNRALFKDGSYFSSISLKKSNSEMILLEYIWTYSYSDR